MKHNNGTTKGIDDIDEEVEALTTQLNRLRLQRKEIERQYRTTRKSIESLELERARRLNDTKAKLDRNGIVIEVGDYVNFLTKGKYKSKGGKVIKVNNVWFITAEDDEGRKINREPQNLEIYRKVNTNHDSRRRH